MLERDSVCRIAGTYISYSALSFTATLVIVHSNHPCQRILLSPSWKRQVEKKRTLKFHIKTTLIKAPHCLTSNKTKGEQTPTMPPKSELPQPDTSKKQATTQGEMNATKDPPKFFIQMSGAPGSGKSTLARRLAVELRSRCGLSAVVINHDVIKSFFLDTELLDTRGIPFDTAAKLSYRLDSVLAEDLIQQGQRVVIVDSVCNYREGIDNGLELARRYGVGYVYLECRVDDVGVLDGRLKGRASGAMSCQRGGVCEGPPAAAGGSASGDEAGGVLFEKWMNPVRPVDGDEARVFVVDSRRKSTEECVDVVLEGLGLWVV